MKAPSDDSWIDKDFLELDKDNEQNMGWTFVKDGAGYVATASTKNSNRVLSVHDASTGQAMQDGSLEREARSNQPNQNNQDDLKTSCEAAGLLSIAFDTPSNRQQKQKCSKKSEVASDKH